MFLKGEIRRDIHSGKSFWVKTLSFFVRRVIMFVSMSIFLPLVQICFYSDYVPIFGVYCLPFFCFIHIAGISF